MDEKHGLYIVFLIYVLYF